MIDTQRDIHGARILIVDDNPTNVLLLERMLGQAGYARVISTTDPTTVSALYAAERFDLILLDLMMPEMDGFQVMEQLRESADDDYLPVLVLTARIDGDARMRALDLGAKDFITKPFQNAEVLLRIRNMLEVRQAYNQRRWYSEILEAEVRMRTRELVDTQFEIIRRLARAGEYRDNETGMHVIRVGKSTHRLALAAGLGERESELMLHASTMHDVGKIGVPDRVLLKPGRLDGSEWGIMKRHARMGADILEGHAAEVMRMARSIALTHHERWDGSGYPNALKGEDIPLEGRITAICDVFDALMSKRPYKQPWPVEEAVEEIRRGSGTSFDPHLVPRFLDILESVIDIRRRYSDDVATDGWDWTAWIDGDWSGADIGNVVA